MGEVPIFTSKAHVFVIDPVTKKSWIPASKTLVQVNFFFDSSRNTFRIISVENSKAIINSTVVPQMNFTKTSGKFGQWADLQAGIVYGLGFSTDLQLSKFSEQFQSIREKSKNVQSQPDKKDEKNKATMNNSHNEQLEGLSDEMLDSSKINNDGYIRTRSSHHDFKSDENTVLEQKHAEDEEKQLHNLKLANKKLTATLQETMADANEWMKKMNTYKDDCEKKQTKIRELEEEKNKLARTVDEMAQKNDALLKKNKEISQECSLLQQRIEVLSVVELQHDQCAARIKSCFDETQEVAEAKKVLEEKLEKAAHQRRADAVEVRKCCAEIAAHLTIITEATQKLQTAM